MSDELQPANPAPAPAEPVMPDDSPAWALAERACWLLLEKQGLELVVLDLRGRSDVCDFFVLASGSADVHVRSLAKNLQDRLLDVGQKARGLEGMDEGRWVLIDFFDVVVHVFHPQSREYYQLERLWGDAPRRDVGPEWFADPDARRRLADLYPATDDA